MAEKGMKFLYLNTRSLYKHFDEIFLHYSGYDIMCFGETWLTEKIPNNVISKQSYNIFRQDRASSIPGKKGGGVATYICNKYGKYSQILHELSTVDPDIEQLWVQVTAPNHKRMLIANIYRPPSGNVTLAIDKIRKSLKLINKFNSFEIVIMGDFNIDMSKRNVNGKKLLIELCRDFNLTELIKDPTRITCTTTSILDLIITNMNFIQCSGVHNQVISDHLPVYMIRKKERNKKSYKVIESRNMKKYDKVLFQKELAKDTRWLDYWNESMVTRKWDILYCIILDCLNRILPKKKIRIRYNSPEWFSKDVLDSIMLKNKAFLNAARLKTAASWAEFREAKNGSQKLIRKSKAAFIQANLELNRNDPKKFWQEINTLLGAGKDRNGAIETIQSDDGTILNGKDAAEFMNNYYVNIGSDLAKEFNNNEWRPSNTFPVQHNKFSFRIITEKECRALIRGIDTTKSSVTTNINSLFIKDAFEGLLFEITYLLNESLRTGEFPLAWGYSIVTPIPKDGDKLKPGNWRPISQMPIIGRLLEKAIHTQLSYYLDSWGILHQNQHGFRKGKSTGSAIFQYVKTLHERYDNNHVTNAIYIDYKKAFDTVSHEILLKKLKLYGFDLSTLHWFENYLNSRSQGTIVNNFISQTQRVKYGVPQGSTLGPTLFILYVNDLFYKEGVDAKTTIMYADDTVIYTSSDTVEEASKEQEAKLSSVVEWCNKNKLTINELKTKYTNFNDKTGNNKLEIKCKNNILEKVGSYKYLGIDISHDLTIDEYVQNVYKKANYKVYMFSKIRKYMTLYAAIMIYKQTILPYMDYSSFLMDSAYNYSLSKLDKIQKRCLRLIEFKDKAHREKDLHVLMRNYRIEPIRERRHRQLLSFMYTESKVKSNLNIKTRNITLRSDNKVKFVEKLTKKTVVQKSPYYRGIEMWNKLPEAVQKLETLAKFKKRLKQIKLI